MPSGGARKGAGRPKGSVNAVKKEIKKDVCLYVRCTKQEKAQLEELAQNAGISLSRFILQKCFN